MENQKADLNIDDIAISTHTFLAYTNLVDLDLEAIFDEVKICDCLVHVLFKKREKGFRKKKKKK